MRIQELTPVDVEHFPDLLEDGVLYISEAYELAAHRCCCGCGEEVMTPLNPARWRLYRSGARVSLVPSIGNWKFACRSHYWIRNNRVVPSYDMSDEEIAEVIEDDQLAREKYFATGKAEHGPDAKARRTRSTELKDWIQRLLARW